MIGCVSRLVGVGVLETAQSRCVAESGGSRVEVVGYFAGRRWSSRGRAWC